MTCERIPLPTGGAMIVCGPRRHSKPCACGRPATQLCDWKIGQRKTCDTPLCTICAVSPTPGKDLCPAHVETFRAWREAKAAAQ